MRVGLTGAKYQRRTQQGPTCDRVGSAAHRWIACDESGWNGEDLYDPAEPILAIGTVAIDDHLAAQVMEDLRRDCRIQASGEVKFSLLKRKPSRLEALARLTSPDGPLVDRVSIYLIDKRYFAAAKIIDLLLEEYLHANGVDLYRDGQARELAVTLFQQGPRALGTAEFDQLVASFVTLCRQATRDDLQPDLDGFMASLDRAWRRSYRRTVSDILLPLTRTRQIASDLLRDRKPGGSLRQALEPLASAPWALAGSWSRRLGTVSLLLDEQKVFTDEALDTGYAQVMNPLPEFRFMWRGVRLHDVVRGTSSLHPSLQLADMYSGAGRMVARGALGLENACPTEFAESISRLTDPYSMVV
jgi:hypothetical protein